MVFIIVVKDVERLSVQLIELCIFILKLLLVRALQKLTHEGFSLRSVNSADVVCINGVKYISVKFVELKGVDENVG